MKWEDNYITDIQETFYCLLSNKEDDLISRTTSNILI